MGVQTTPGDGSALWIELPQVEGPLARHERTPEPAAMAAADSHQQRTVLYIEDNLSNLKLVQVILQRRPEVKLLSAMQGDTGLQMAREHVPALILLDLHLPDMTGHDVLLRLRAEPATRQTPVIVLSADATPGQIARLLSAGAHGYLTKPLDVKKFLDIIDQTMQKLDSRQGGR